MPKSEACKVWIEQRSEELQDEGMKYEEIGRKVSGELMEYLKISVKPRTIARKARRKNDVTSVTEPKLAKTHTKPEVKIQISKIAGEILMGAVSDEDVKHMGDALADAVGRGICDKRVITKAHTAVKKENAKGREVKLKEIDNYQRLERHVTAATNGLQLLADGSIPMHETENEKEAAIIIKKALPNLCLQIARLGVNLIEVNDIFYKGDQNGKRPDQKKIEHFLA